MDQPGPSTDDLIRYVLDDLEAGMAGVVEQAMRDRAEVGRAIQRIREMVAGLRESQIEAPPARLRDMLKALFEARPATPPDGFDADMGRVLAELVADTRRQELVGYRGALTAYQLTFEADGAEVHLQAAPIDGRDDAMRVRGQIDADDDAPLDAVWFEPVGGGEPIAASRTGGGYFTADLTIGVYDLRLERA